MCVYKYLYFGVKILILHIYHANLDKMGLDRGITYIRCFPHSETQCVPLLHVDLQENEEATQGGSVLP